MESLLENNFYNLIFKILKKDMRSVILIFLSFVGFATTRSFSLPSNAYSLATAQCYIDCNEALQSSQLSPYPEESYNQCISGCDVNSIKASEKLSLNGYCINSCFETLSLQVNNDP